MMTMTPEPPERLAHRLDGFDGRVVVVLGDVMLDHYTWGRVRRISPEAPVPVVEVERETWQPGGSANVAANIRALGGKARAVGVVGPDPAAERLGALLDERGIGGGFLVSAPARRTTLKTRIIAHSQQVVRTDREDRTPVPPEIVDALVGSFLRALSGADAVVVSDYDKGVVNPAVLDAVLPAAREAGVPVFLDPKVQHAAHYRPVTVITPNQGEAEMLSGLVVRDRGDLENAGRKLLSRFGCPYILITRGEDGMALFAEGAVEHIPAVTREVFDVSGAGDTVIATLALAHAAGATMTEAAWLANYAAGIVVGKLGTATSTRQEIRGVLDRHRP